MDFFDHLPTFGLHVFTFRQPPTHCKCLHLNFDPLKALTLRYILIYFSPNLLQFDLLKIGPKFFFVLV